MPRMIIKTWKMMKLSMHVILIISNSIEELGFKFCVVNEIEKCFYKKDKRNFDEGCLNIFHFMKVEFYQIEIMISSVEFWKSKPLHIKMTWLFLKFVLILFALVCLLYSNKKNACIIEKIHLSDLL